MSFFLYLSGDFFLGLADVEEELSMTSEGYPADEHILV
jgi:hypothetical protein